MMGRSAISKEGPIGSEPMGQMGQNIENHGFLAGV